MRKGFQRKICAVAAMLLVPSALVAQDTDAGQDIGTSTPPELRDFRLDTPPPRQASESTQPAPGPATQPPAATQQPAAERGTSAPPAATMPARRAEPGPARNGAPSSVQAGTQSQPAEATPAPILIAPPGTGEAASTPTAVPATQAASAAWPLPWIGAAAAALLALIAGVILWRRRKTPRQLQRENEAPAEQPSPPARLEKAPPLTVDPSEEGAPLRLAANAATLQAEFRPEAAQLSIASLTITGTLTLVNKSKAAIDGLVLRSQMISAQDGQNEMIATFHASKGAGSLQQIGSLAAGERIDAVIEIRLPRNELASFRWTEREFVAPIVLLNLLGHADGADVEVRLSRLIGREGSGATPRMKPLAIDRGPKRFTGVSARPILA